jgi:hypothetical protein
MLFDLLASWQAYRTKVLAEIVTTEVNYVKVLQQLVDDFLNPLRQAAASEDTAVISKQSVQAMFPNIDILYNINKQFLEDLQERQKKWSSTQKIGDIFLKMVTLRTHTRSSLFVVEEVFFFTLFFDFY